MKFQSPGSGLWLFYQLAKLYGGHFNWYRGKCWAFRTRWRLIFAQKGGSFFRAKLVKFELEEAYYWRRQLRIAGFHGNLFGLIWFNSMNFDLLHGLFCFVLCLSRSFISNLYGRQDSLRARKGESPGPCTFGVKSSG